VAKTISTEVYSKVRFGFTGLLAFAFVLTLSAGFFSAALAQEEEVEYEYVYEEVEEDAPAVAAEPAPSVTKKRSSAASKGKKISLGVQLGADNMLVGGYDISRDIKAELGLSLSMNGNSDGAGILSSYTLLLGGYYGLVKTQDLSFSAGLNLSYFGLSYQTVTASTTDPTPGAMDKTTTNYSAMELIPAARMEYFLAPAFSFVGILGLEYTFSASEELGNSSLPGVPYYYAGDINTAASAGFRWYVF